MGRGKIDIKRIENANSRQVTFSKRRAGLLKKANELSILCDAEVAVIIFSHTGKAFEFTSHGMKKTLCRYNKCVNTPEAPVVELKTEKQEAEEVGSLREEIAKLKVEQTRLLGKDLHGASLKELQQLELQINEGLLSVKKKKEQLLLEQLEQSRIQEQRAMLENETLSKQVQELQEFLPPSERPVQAYLEYYPAMTNSPVKQATVSSDTVCDFEADNDNSDTTLQLGLPSEVSQKQNTGSFDSWRCRM